MLTKSLWNKGCRLAFFFIAATTSTLRGQVLQTARYELPLATRDSYVETSTAGTAGLFLYSIYIGPENDLVQLIKVDTAFREEWSGYIPIEKNYVVMGQKSFGDKLYLLLRYKDYSKNDFSILAINNSTAEYYRYTVRGFIPISPTEFHVTSNAALIGGYYNRVPVVIYFSFLTQRSNILPGLFNEAGELTQVKTYADGSFDVLISARNFTKQRTMWVKNYDADGHMLRNMPLNPGGDHHLIFGRAIKTPDREQLIAGVYGGSNAEYSRGIFVAALDAEGHENVRYFNFGELENFFKYMKAKRELRIKSRIERKKIRGKNIRFNYRFLVHELIPYQGNYILLGEAFYPKYRYPRSTYGYGQSAARIFDGYIYTHAVVMCFDKNGNLLWDNSFEINDVRTFSLQQFVKIETHNDRIVLFYLFDDAIRTKVIKGDQVLEGKNIDPISIFSENERVANAISQYGRLEYWYDKHLYACGVQEIVNSANGRQTPRRRVFYVNKVSFDGSSEN